MGFRIFWALFLAGCLAYAFHRTWTLEHGESMPETLFGGDQPRTKVTTVWWDPTLLPVMLLIILLIFGFARGMDGVKQALSLSLDVMIVISIYFLLLVLLLPVFRRHFSARACATMWILPVYMFWQAHMLLRNAPIPNVVIYIPNRVLEVLYRVWGIGFVIVFAGKVISHFLFRHSVMSASFPVRNRQIRELFDCELKKLEYYDPVDLVISSAVKAPLSMGASKLSRVTVLPNREFTQQELQFIFRHEIHHLQRGDVSNKIFFAFCQALCWFNPLIWVATRKASDDLELSCDEIVLEGMDEKMRRQYAELLLDTAGQSKGFTTCLSAAGETMRYRLKSVMTIRERWPGTILLFAAMFLCVMSYGTIAVSHERGTVKDLITEHRTAADITDVYYQSEDSAWLAAVHAWDSEGLFSYLESMDVEKFSSANEFPDMGRQRLSVRIENSGVMQLEIYERMIKVYHFRNGGRTEYFYLRSEPDWEIIKEYLDFEAEESKKMALQDPQLRVYFNVEEQPEPITAVRQFIYASDIETGETLRSSKNSDPVGGLYGLRPTQAQLVFDMPVSEVTVWANNREYTTQVLKDLDVEENRYILALEPYSAHYMVNVVFEPENGVHYDATYEFDVVYPDEMDEWQE